MEAWKWALIGVAIAAVVVMISVAGAIYYYRNKGKTISNQDSSCYVQEEQCLDTIIEQDNSLIIVDPDLLDQQEQYAIAVQTALSPPRPQVVKEKIASTPNKIIHDKIIIVMEDGSQQHESRQFSLSPLHEKLFEKPSQRTLSVCSTDTIDQRMTPLQAYRNTINFAWRTSTPSTQNSTRNTSRYSS